MVRKAEQSYTITVEGIPVLVTHKRVKNINYRIDTNGNARMSVPWHVSKSDALRYAESRVDWFREHQRKRVSQAAEQPRAWTTGERLRVWGDEVRLEVEKTEGQPACELVGESLVLRVPAGSTVQGRAAFVERWMQDGLRQRLAELTPVCEKRVGVRATSYTLRRMKTRWGSCTPSTGRIRLNTALAECLEPCLEMVLVHELCHLVEASHSPRFKALMDLHCPGWRAYQRWLDEHPPRA